MKALSIRQPWAWAILYAGKNIENRDWNDRYPGLSDAHRLVEQAIEDGGDGGEFLIHASAGMTNAEFEDALETISSINHSALPLPPRESLERGGIVGRAQLYDVVTKHDSPWFFGRVGLVLHNARPLPFVPFKGALGFFEVPDNITAPQPDRRHHEADVRLRQALWSGRNPI